METEESDAQLRSSSPSKGIAISYLSQESEDARKAAEQIVLNECDVNLVEVDLQKEEDCYKLIASHMARFRCLDILVNNASEQMSVRTIQEQSY